VLQRRGEGALTVLPAEPWRLDETDPTRIVDADGENVLVAASPVVARHVLSLHALATRSPTEPARPVAAPRLERTRTYRTAEELAPFAPEGATMPALPTIGLVVEEHFRREQERLADPVAWERKQAAAKAVADRDARERSEREKAQRIEEWIDRAIARGCPSHRPTMLAVMKAKLTPAMQAVRNALTWYNQHRQGPLTTGAMLILCGSNGAGKTTAGTYAVATWRGSARFVTADYIAGLPDSDYGEYVKLRDELLTYELLTIDECGVEVSNRAGRRVWSILLKRYNAGKLTLVTTNLSRDAFIQRYMATIDEEKKPVPDERVRSRLNNEQRKAGLEPFAELPPVDYRGRS
jgi:DNA replication protein DnaC